MSQTVKNYHPKVKRTGTTIQELIAGTSCFPGGAGIWRGAEDHGRLPDVFPEAPVMFVGHNFDSERGYNASLTRGGEAGGQFWQKLLAILEGSEISPSECFFTNALMGIKPGSATGAMPSVTGYRDQCSMFLVKQVDIVKPRAVIALGVNAEKYISSLDEPWMKSLHPGNWHFRTTATRRERLLVQGAEIGEFLTTNKAALP